MNFKIKEIDNKSNKLDILHKDGFVHIKNFLTFQSFFINEWIIKCFNLIDDFTYPSNIDLQDGLLRLSKVFEDKQKWDNFRKIYVGIFQRNMDIYNISSHPSIMNFLKSIGINKPYLSSDPLLMLNGGNFCNVLGSYTDSPLHQDWASMQSSANSVVLWVPLVDVDKHSTGSIKVWPGTQDKGLFQVKNGKWFAEITKNKNELTKQKPLEVVANSGDCILFSSLLVHQSITSKSGKKIPRLTLQLRYGDLDCKLLKDNNGVFNYNHCVPNKKPFERINLNVPAVGWNREIKDLTS